MSKLLKFSALSVLLCLSFAFAPAQAKDTQSAKEPWTGVESQRGYRNNALMDAETKKHRKHKKPCAKKQPAEDKEEAAVESDATAEEAEKDAE